MNPSIPEYNIIFHDFYEYHKFLNARKRFVWEHFVFKTHSFETCHTLINNLETITTIITNEVLSLKIANSLNIVPTQNKTDKTTILTTWNQFILLFTPILLCAPARPSPAISTDIFVKTAHIAPLQIVDSESIFRIWKPPFSSTSPPYKQACFWRKTVDAFSFIYVNSFGNIAPHACVGKIPISETRKSLCR